MRRSISDHHSVDGQRPRAQGRTSLCSSCKDGPTQPPHTCPPTVLSRTACRTLHGTPATRRLSSPTCRIRPHVLRDPNEWGGQPRSLYPASWLMQEASMADSPDRRRGEPSGMSSKVSDCSAVRRCVARRSAFAKNGRAADEATVVRRDVISHHVPGHVGCEPALYVLACFVGPDDPVWVSQAHEAPNRCDR
ncbi:hypothetical protein PYCCODRAFT_19974 [Trametes coccinea BRFM310]|uniref:Uncharacterized protein n=1 Tax=Trametes coccinea (strain BRFM310) TaxID=1353009 RepID=A0A1Y2J4V2_TRAC3|nr:hypothetical protein PYCCODRAFT_19974 [Trametes coccinea BRFM310]